MRLARKFCRSASIDLDADDVVQEALVAFWELAENGYPISNPKALLVKITKNICISRYRKRKLSTESISDDNFLGGFSATSEVDLSDEKIIKQRLYAALTKTERLYMLMKTEDGFDVEDLIQKTGGSRAGIQMALSRAKRKLQTQLKKIGYDK